MYVCVCTTTYIQTVCLWWRHRVPELSRQSAELVAGNWEGEDTLVTTQMYTKTTPSMLSWCLHRTPISRLQRWQATLMPQVYRIAMFTLRTWKIFWKGLEANLLFAWYPLCITCKTQLLGDTSLGHLYTKPTPDSHTQVLRLDHLSCTSVTFKIHVFFKTCFRKKRFSNSMWSGLLVHYSITHMGWHSYFLFWFLQLRLWT